MQTPAPPGLGAVTTSSTSGRRRLLLLLHGDRISEGGPLIREAIQNLHRDGHEVRALRGVRCVFTTCFFGACSGRPLHRPAQRIRGRSRASSARMHAPTEETPALVALTPIHAPNQVTVRVTYDSGDVDRFVEEAALLDGANRFGELGRDFAGWEVAAV